MIDSDLAEAILSELQSQTAHLSSIGESLANIETTLSDGLSSIELTLSSIESSLSSLEASSTAMESEITTGGFPPEENNVLTGSLGWRLWEIKSALEGLESTRF